MGTPERRSTPIPPTGTICQITKIICKLASAVGPANTVRYGTIIWYTFLRHPLYLCGRPGRPDLRCSSRMVIGCPVTHVANWCLGTETKKKAMELARGKTSRVVSYFVLATATSNKVGNFAEKETCLPSIPRYDTRLPSRDYLHWKGNAEANRTNCISWTPRPSQAKKQVRFQSSGSHYQSLVITSQPGQGLHPTQSL